MSEQKETKVLILSHKRHDIITTHNVVANAIIVVPESQFEKYRDACPNTEIATHPDDIVGISPKRQWCLDKFGDCFMLDDDLLKVSRVYEEIHVSNLFPTEVYSLIQDVYNIALLLPCGIYGFNKDPNPLAYHGDKPVVFNNFINSGAIGVISGRNIHFPNIHDFIQEDYYVNCLNAFHNRYSYKDNRFAFAFNNSNHTKGGCADFRTDELRKRYAIELRKCFGNAIVRKKSSHIRRQVSEFEISLKIPF